MRASTESTEVGRRVSHPVLDACRSGALTRVKGGRPVPPVSIAVRDRLAGEGTVFLTATSANEDAQESDEIKGSFFTHFLVSGLMCAADASGAARVVLDVGGSAYATLDLGAATHVQRRRRFVYGGQPGGQDSPRAGESGLDAAAMVRTGRGLGVRW